MRAVLFVLLTICISGTAFAAEGCLSCHEGIERFTDGLMIEQIEELGAEHGDAAGCVICHGGTPSATSAEEAHKGSPASLAEADGPPQLVHGFHARVRDGGGSPSDVVAGDLVAMSTDGVALDAFGATLLSLEAQELAYLGLAEQRGCGTADWRSLDPKEITA